MKKATQADIARSLGISQATVTLVVGNNASPLRQRLSPETVRRVMEKARELGYSPHKGAQMMRKGGSQTIVLLNFGGHSDLAAKRAYHVGRLVHEAGYDYQAIDAYWWAGDADRIVDQIIALRPKGLLITGSAQNNFGREHIQRLAREKFPIIAIGTERPGIPVVRFDGRSSVRTITEWCLDQGRKRLLMVIRQSEQNPSRQAADRLAGFSDAVEARTGKPPRTWTGLACPDLKPADGVRAAIAMIPAKRLPFEPYAQIIESMEAIMRWPQLPDAMVCINDDFAVAAATVCARHAISVPGQIMISGFDNIAYTSLGLVPLTTVEQPIEAMCQRAFELLMEKMTDSGKASAASQTILLPCNIVWRQSTDSLAPASARHGSLPPAQVSR